MLQFSVLFCAGTLWGQAAVFNQYELEDGTLVTVQGEAPPPSAIEIPPSQEDVAAAEAAVAEQAAAVRALKEQQGLGNQVKQTRLLLGWYILPACIVPLFLQLKHLMLLSAAEL